MKVGKVVNDDRADWREAWALFPGSVAYIWHAGTKAGIMQDSLAACGFEIRSQIIWAKNRLAPHMGATRFTRWIVKGSDLPLQWDDALKRGDPAG